MSHQNAFVNLAQAQLASRLVPFWGVNEAPRLFQGPLADAEPAREAPRSRITATAPPGMAAEVLPGA